ncbi:MAG: TVP38/TMEM64 family protein [Elainellaceae cyanobacterium]
MMPNLSDRSRSGRLPREDSYSASTDRMVADQNLGAVYVHPISWKPISWKTLRWIGLMLSSFVFASLGQIVRAVPAIAQEPSDPSLVNGLHTIASSFNVQQLLADALSWIQGLGVVGALVFMGIYIVATVAFLPGSILTLGAGFVFGVVQGSILVFVGASIGAIASFLIGRYVARSRVAQMIEGNRRFKAIDEAVGREGLKIVLLTRLSPLFPFNLLNYGFGVTGVSLKDYSLGCFGMLPGTVMYVYLGSLAGNLAMLATGDRPENAAVQWAIRIIGFIATAAVTIYVTRVAQKALKEAVPDADAEANDDSHDVQADFASELNSDPESPH